MPVFWLGLMLLLLFYRNLHWLPGSGRLDVTIIPPAHVTGLYLVDAILEGSWGKFRNGLSHIILPAFCLYFPGIIYPAIFLKIRVFQSDVLLWK